MLELVWLDSTWFRIRFDLNFDVVLTWFSFWAWVRNSNNSFFKSKFCFCFFFSIQKGKFIRSLLFVSALLYLSLSYWLKFFFQISFIHEPRCNLEMNRCDGQGNISMLFWMYNVHILPCTSQRYKCKIGLFECVILLVKISYKRLKALLNDDCVSWRDSILMQIRLTFRFSFISRSSRIGWRK